MVYPVIKPKNLIHIGELFIIIWWVWQSPSITFLKYYAINTSISFTSIVTMSRHMSTFDFFFHSSYQWHAYMTCYSEVYKVGWQMRFPFLHNTWQVSPCRWYHRGSVWLIRRLEIVCKVADGKQPESLADIRRRNPTSQVEDSDTWRQQVISRLDAYFPLIPYF